MVASVNYFCITNRPETQQLTKQTLYFFHVSVDVLSISSTLGWLCSSQFSFSHLTVLFLAIFDSSQIIQVSLTHNFRQEILTVVPQFPLGVQLSSSKIVRVLGLFTWWSLVKSQLINTIYIGDKTMLNIGQSKTHDQSQNSGRETYNLFHDGSRCKITAHRVHVRCKEYEAILQSSRVYLLTTKYLHSLHLKIMLTSLLGLPKVLT